MLKEIVEFDSSESSQDIINMLIALKADNKTDTEELYCDLVAAL